MRRRLLNIALIGLMAFLWMAQASHCHAENIPGLDFLACNGNNAENEAHSCCGGTCKTGESRQTKTEEKKRVASPQPEVPHWLTPSLIALLLSEPETDRGIAIADVRPEFPKCWQFLSRTALPVRAPSFLA
jgi:hypothetical protein